MLEIEFNQHDEDIFDAGPGMLAADNGAGLLECLEVLRVQTGADGDAFFDRALGLGEHGFRFGFHRHPPDQFPRLPGHRPLPGHDPLDFTVTLPGQAIEQFGRAVDLIQQRFRLRQRAQAQLM